MHLRKVTMCPDHAEVNTAAALGTLQVLTSLALIIIVYAVGTYKWKRRHLEKVAAQLPGPPALPIVGNALEFMGNPQDMFSRFYELIKQYGYDSTARIWMGPILIVYVGKPEDLQIILNSRHALEKASSMYRFIKEYSGNGLLTAPVETWRTHRRAIQPAFNSKLLEKFVPVFNKHNKKLVDTLNPHVNGGQFDISQYISTFNMDIICETAMGIDENTPAQRISELCKAAHRVNKLAVLRCFKIWFHSDFIFYTWMKLRYGYNARKKLLEQLFRLPDTIIKQKKEEYRLKKENKSGAPNGICELESERKSKVFIDILLKLSDAGANFSDDDLRDEVYTMLEAGSDTTAVTTCFIILMLSIHQDIQENVHKELIDIFGDSERHATVEDLKKMTYTEMVIKETLRIYPIVPIVLRTLTQDIDLTDHKLPAGCNVAIYPFGMHRNPNVFPNPEQFNPENFTPENIAKRHRYSYIPFSGGPRNCIGALYGMLSIKTTISTLVRNYRFYSDIRTEDIKLRADLLLRSVNGFPVRIVNRK